MKLQTFQIACCSQPFAFEAFSDIGSVAQCIIFQHQLWLKDRFLFHYHAARSQRDVRNCRLVCANNFWKITFNNVQWTLILESFNITTTESRILCFASSTKSMKTKFNLLRSTHPKKCFRIGVFQRIPENVEKILNLEIIKLRKMENNQKTRGVHFSRKNGENIVGTCKCWENNIQNKWNIPKQTYMHSAFEKMTMMN